MQSDPAPTTSSSIISLGTSEAAQAPPVVELGHTPGEATSAEPIASVHEKSQIPEDIPPLVDDAIDLIVYLAGSGDPPRPENISAVFTAKKAIEENKRMDN
jgi:hypothetical protein